MVSSSFQFVSIGTLTFKGDVQNLEEEMFEFEDYSLEKTLVLLRKKFPNHNIFIFRPNRVEGFHSCFDDLLEPGHTVLHLCGVLNSLQEKIKELKGMLGSSPDSIA